MKSYAIVLLAGAASLNAAISSCRPASSFEQGHELKQSQMMAAYNAPGRIDVRGSWDLFLSASYLFWQPSEDGLALGISNSSATAALPLSGNIVNMDFNYKSGFQVALGVFSEFDDWDATAKFTWVNGRDATRSNGPYGGGLIPSWGHPANVPSTVYSGKGKWKVGISALDIVLGRSHYVGTRLLFHPFFGMRPSWINQKYIATYATTLSTSPTTYQIRTTTNSWGIGPEAGIEASWMLGSGIRLTGSAEADLLFTRYNIRYKEQNSTTPSGPLRVDLAQKKTFCLRPHADFSLGFGWGSYLDNYNYHIDLAAAYDFQIFWDQNMFPNFVDNVMVAKFVAPNGNLYTQGVTGTIRFDF